MKKHFERITLPKSFKRGAEIPGIILMKYCDDARSMHEIKITVIQPDCIKQSSMYPPFNLPTLYGQGLARVI